MSNAHVHPLFASALADFQRIHIPGKGIPPAPTASPDDPGVPRREGSGASTNVVSIADRRKETP